MRNYIEKELYLNTQKQLVELIVSNIESRRKQTYYAINSDCMLQYWSDADYRKLINKEKNLVYVDGMGVIYAQKILKIPQAVERIATTDLFPALLDYLNRHKKPLRIFLLGGKGDTAERVKSNFANRYPHTEIVGTHHGYFDKIADSKQIINDINAQNIDILFVGFGNPVQEKWVDEYFDSLQVQAIITCGGLFDYYANNVKRAPLFMQKLGFEWLFRLMQEPRRLFKRYIFGNMKYIAKVFSIKLSNP
ncbi:WecB/TagA/CpsF family glycosyltransferase [Ureibacillus chungkukjangi]|uniref:N-acetylglucosaminyldiphosphoundecaprenol N-acetyl-beta-D-mannosaminyltransferase n=1 Tax=Ureibacillus chungkukjangi TaxID=1202712 RepID=A0A318TMU4_9BACL|nr:WecB/TagA/CpsF family glycosyltransferase [Ureibacillus chungkukjangi]MCM3386884.1 WecB/TagA/CpsF family glycosyltransferase [Ureibacillus chungkukjangi]PYF06066.1 N-acetylglucosaminyldiphosphoundecaprenol N-acetyl-beta-D-mannosaminyltransferase [Ureibacillus chungkukjangi]